MYKFTDIKLRVRDIGIDFSYRYDRRFQHAGMITRSRGWETVTHNPLPLNDDYVVACLTGIYLHSQKCDDIWKIFNTTTYHHLELLLHASDKIYILESKWCMFYQVIITNNSIIVIRMWNDYFVIDFDELIFLDRDHVVVKRNNEISDIAKTLTNKFILNVK